MAVEATAEQHESTKLIKVTAEQRSLFDPYFTSTSDNANIFVELPPNPWEGTFVDQTLQGLKIFSASSKAALEDQESAEVAWLKTEEASHRWKSKHQNKSNDCVTLAEELEEKRLESAQLKEEVSALSNVQDQLGALQTQLKEKGEEFEQRQKELEVANSAAYQELTGLLKGKGEELQQKHTELEAAKSASTATTQKLRELETQLKEKGEELEQKQKELEDANSNCTAAKQQLAGPQTQLEQQKAELKSSRAGTL